MNRAFTNILSGDPDKAATFYQTLLGLVRHFDSDWFVILTHPDLPGFEFGILSRDHETMPTECREAPQGVVVTFVVADLEAVLERATALDAETIQMPTRMPYGQTRLLLRDPDGAIVDISSPQ
ncbi:MAG: VOC family protein [Hyphomicrobiales bacterium]